MSDPSLGVVDRVLRFVDRPWKIAAVAILVLTAVIAVTLYEHRGELAETVLEGWVKPRLEPERFTSKLGVELMGQTRADLVVLVRIDLHNNLATSIEGFRRDDPAWKPPENPRPVFYSVRDPLELIGLIEGHAVCRDIDTSDGSDEMRALAALGMRRRCLIAVPPVLDALVGALNIAWRTPLGAEAESGAQRLLYVAATRLATW
jgi:hypothetical protein